MRPSKNSKRNIILKIPPNDACAPDVSHIFNVESWWKHKRGETFKITLFLVLGDFNYICQGDQLLVSIKKWVSGIVCNGLIDCGKVMPRNEKLHRMYYVTHNADYESGVGARLWDILYTIKQNTYK